MQKSFKSAVFDLELTTVLESVYSSGVLDSPSTPMVNA